ncbi:MAG: hypothetical protein ACK4VY_08390, partial [Brevundimonas sp.]
GARAAVAAASDARAQAAVAREHAVREVANARVHMQQGADQMVAGAGEMRAESARLGDPAWRAVVIERARARGETVTDAELRALSPRLARQADELERRAVDLRERAARPPPCGGGTGARRSLSAGPRPDCRLPGPADLCQLALQPRGETSWRVRYG